MNRRSSRHSGLCMHTEDNKVEDWGCGCILDLWGNMRLGPCGTLFSGDLPRNQGWSLQ